MKNLMVVLFCLIAGCCSIAYAAPDTAKCGDKCRCEKCECCPCGCCLSGCDCKGSGSCGMPAKNTAEASSQNDKKA